MKRDPEETAATILESGLKEISRKGFSDATIRQIAQNAKVTALTVFRHFTDKETLFESIINAYSCLEIDAEELDRLLSYKDLRKDLDILSQEYFKIVFSNLDIIRIFINEAYNNPMVEKKAWFISPVLRDHLKTYLTKIGLGGNHKDEISEMFIAHITRRVLEYNTHDSIWSYSEEILDDFKHNIRPQLIWFEETIKNH